MLGRPSGSIVSPDMPIRVQIERRASGTALNFPEFEDGSQLRLLVEAIAAALGTRASAPRPSLELFVGFEGYPSPFELWWDGYTCELACAEPCGVDVDAIADRLVASGNFTIDPAEIEAT